MPFVVCEVLTGSKLELKVLNEYSYGDQFILCMRTV